VKSNDNVTEKVLFYQKKSYRTSRSFLEMVVSNSLETSLCCSAKKNRPEFDILCMLEIGQFSSKTASIIGSGVF